MIGKINRVALREVWKHEALDFTQWLEENIDVLNEVLDINLSNPEREKVAGSFNVDIVAEDDSGDPVVIENQQRFNQRCIRCYGSGFRVHAHVNSMVLKLMQTVVKVGECFL